jgi:hypothetical protein
MQASEVYEPEPGGERRISALAYQNIFQDADFILV